MFCSVGSLRQLETLTAESMMADASMVEILTSESMMADASMADTSTAESIMATLAYPILLLLRISLS